MSKSILVIDTPRSCDECDACVIGSVVFCGMNGNKIEQEIMNESKRSAKCPLRDFPRRKMLLGLDGISNAMEIRERGRQEGYNACIDEILKGDGAE